MKQFLFISGIILILLMILMFLDKNKSLQEAFGTLPSASQSSYLSSDIPGATTTNPTVAKPSDKEIIDARDIVYQFMDLCKNVKVSITDKQKYQNLQNAAPIFLNELSALRNNPDIVNASTFYTKRNSYKSAVESLKQKPLFEGFATNSIQEDVANLLDAIAIFEDEYTRADISKISYTNDKNFVNDLHAKAEGTSTRMKKSSLPPDPAFAAKVQQETSDYQRGFFILSQLPSKPDAPVQTGTGTNNTDTITLDGLKSLIANIQAEQLRLENLRSSDSTTLARISTLESLLVDLRDYVGKVERDEIKLQDVPIKASDAQTFLAQFKSSDTLPYLIEESGTTETSKDSSPANFYNTTSSKTEVPQVSSEQVQGMPMIPTNVLQYLKNLEWTFEIKVHNNPEIGHRERIMDRIKELEQRIAAYAYNDVPIPYSLQNAFRKELQYLTNSMQNSVEPSYSPENNSLYTENTRIADDIRDNEEYDNSELFETYNPYMNTSTSNEDAMIRPGFVMTDETIKRRGSASAFDESIVGGADYKQRSRDLCRQIKSAQLGDPANFGCIENQDEVSSSYSWKGNFKMVCNRLGDTWGSWYPEMFGCPTYDSTARYKGSQFTS